MAISEKQLIANRLNAQKAGRKKGLATIEREKAKDYIAQRIGEYMPQIFEVLIKKGLQGDIMAIRELFDRAWGKAQQDIGFDKSKPFMVQISEVLARKYELEDKEMLQLNGSTSIPDTNSTGQSPV